MKGSARLLIDIGFKRLIWDFAAEDLEREYVFDFKSLLLILGMFISLFIFWFVKVNEFR